MRMLLLLFILIAMLNPVAGKQKGTGDGAGKISMLCQPKLTFRITAAEGWEKRIH